MRYEVQIDLKRLSLMKRNNIVNAIQNSNDRYQLENQVISITMDTMRKIIDKI